MVKTFYTSIEIVFTEKNNVIVAKIPTLLRVMATMNIYKTGTINIQAEGEPILELYKDIGGYSTVITKSFEGFC